uniref:Ubiquitin hydrolase n=1 Tax=Tanacetum cinerariifolium TaxID=118510 RepID=A0A6L2JG52_TANCI|nr:ubiquitin hydrolase [Tanacetum cinerariifolium]
MSHKGFRVALEGKSVVPHPPAQIYSPPKKDMSWTGLPEFADDIVTDYSRPAPTAENSPDDAQNRNPSVTATEPSPSTISPKPFIKFVKANDSPTKSKTDKVATAKKPPVKYAELYKKPLKKSTVRGNQRNWNNLKSQQLGENIMMKNKVCVNYGDFNHLSYDCCKWVEQRKSRPKNNYTHKSMPPRDDFHQTGRSPTRTTRPNMNAAPRPHVNNARPQTTQDLMIILIQRVKSLERELKARTLHTKIHTVDRGISRSVMAWVPKKDMSWTGLPEFADDIVTDYSRPAPTAKSSPDDAQNRNPFDMSWTGLLEFADDIVTDYSRPAPTAKSSPDDAQNRNPFVTATEPSPSTISPKPFIKFVKANDSPTKSKIDKVEIAKKPPVKYAKLYKKPSKKSTVRGNQRNWNNLKSQQLRENFVMKNKVCVNYGDFNHLSYDCCKWVEQRKSRPKNNHTHKSMPPRDDFHKTGRSPTRTTRPNMNAAPRPHVNNTRPQTTQDLMIILIQRVKRLERELKARTLHTKIHTVDRGKSRSVMAWVPKKSLVRSFDLQKNKTQAQQKRKWEDMLFQYKLALAQVEKRLTHHRDRELKYCEKIRVLEFQTESRANCIKCITKDLELLKREKGKLETKHTGFQTTSKDLDSLLESQRLDKNTEGLGYSVVPPPPAQIYYPPKKDMSWTGLSEFADDIVTDNIQLKVRQIKLRQLRNLLLSMLNFTKKPSKKSTVRGNQRNWNNLKSQQLGENFVMKNKVCVNYGDFNHLSYDCCKWVEQRKSRPKNNYTHKSMPPRDDFHKTGRSPTRTTRPNMNAAPRPYVNNARPQTTQDLMIILIHRVKRLERELKARTLYTKIHKVDRGRSRSVMAWVPKKACTTAESSPDDAQNRNPSVTATEPSPSTISPKPFIKFVKANDSPTKIKTDKVEIAKKPPVKEDMLFQYKLALAQVKERLAQHKNQELKYCEKIRVLEFQTESRANSSKDLDNLFESQRLDKNKEGLRYSVVPPPPAQIYSPPKKDMSWNGLPEFADDIVTDYSRHAPTAESSPDDAQNRNPSITATEPSPSTISPKPFIKFVKANDSLTKIFVVTQSFSHCYTLRLQPKVVDPIIKSFNKWYQSLVRSFDLQNNKTQAQQKKKMVKSSTSSENEACCSKSYKKNTDSLNSNITELTDNFGDRENMLFQYKLALAQVEERLAQQKNQELKYCEKIRVLEFQTESRANCIECLTKDLELLKMEKGELETKLTGFQTASKDLDNLFESQRLDKNKEGLGYNVVPPFPAQINSPPKKDMSWTGLSEFADDIVTDYSRHASTPESSTDDAQNKNPSVTMTEPSPSTISPKPFIKFVKENDNPTKSKTGKVMTAKKPPVKYAELYKKPSKKSTVRGNQRNWNNLKSQQLGENFVMKNKVCFNCGDFNHLSYDCCKWVEQRKLRPKNNYTHKSMPPRDDFHKSGRSPTRTTRPNMNAAPRPHVNNTRPQTTRDLMIILIQRVKRLERELKARTLHTKIHKVDRGRSRSVMAWVLKKIPHKLTVKQSILLVVLDLKPRYLSKKTKNKAKQTKPGTRMKERKKSKPKNRLAFYNDDDEYSIHYKEYLENYSNAIAPVLPTEEPDNSLNIGDELLSTIPKIESDKVIKSSVENLVPIPSESSDEKSLSNEDIPKEIFKIYSNPLFDNEIISSKIDLHHFNVESDLIESLLNQDTSIDSSPKFDYFLEEFSGELAHTNPIPPGIEEADFDLEEEIRLVENLLYDNSSPRPPKELNAKIADTIVESLSPSPIPVEDSDSQMEEIDLFLDTDDLMQPGIKNDDYDSEGDIHFLEELLSNDLFPIPENESFNFDHHDDPSFPRPPSEPPDVEIFFDFEPDTGVLTAKVMEDISEHYVFMPKFLHTLPTLCPNIDTLLLFSFENVDKVFKPIILSYLLVSHRDKVNSDFSENPMMMYAGDISLLDVSFLHFYPP